MSEQRKGRISPWDNADGGDAPVPTGYMEISKKEAKRLKLVEQMPRVTEDQIVEEASKDSTYCQLSVDIGLWAAQAQREALAKWIQEQGLDTELSLSR